MELLSNCITDAKQSTENNDIVEEKKEGEENETDEIEIKEEDQPVDAEKVTQEEQPADASENKEDEETDEQPAQQSFIHPMILEKLDDFIENAKKGFEEALAPATKEEVAPIEGENGPISQEEEKEEEEEVVPQEDNRNDSDEEVDPVDAKEDKAEEEAGRDDHPIDEGRLEESKREIESIMCRISYLM